LTKILNVMR